MKVTIEPPPKPGPLRFRDLAGGEAFRCNVDPAHAHLKVIRWTPDGPRGYRAELTTGDLAETLPDVEVTRLDAEVIVREPPGG